MRFLLDTNVLITLEPRSTSEMESGAAAAARLNQLLTGGAHSALVHPAIEHDIERDDDLGRKELNRYLFVDKYTQLQHPPSSREVESALGSPVVGSNDWVDMQLIAAVHGNAVDYVVTEDERLIRRFRRVRLGDRALTIAAAVRTLEDLFEVDVPPPPVVEAARMHSLDRSDGIWESFRHEYAGFDEWFARSSRQDRPAWFVAGDQGYEAVCIVKSESEGNHGLEGEVLKVCSFKVAEAGQGRKLGELLLKTVFRHAATNGHAAIYVEAFAHHEHLVSLFDDFGFAVSEAHATQRGELVLVKPLRPRSPESLSEFEYHRRYGPPAVHPSSRIYIVPIKPPFPPTAIPRRRGGPHGCGRRAGVPPGIEEPRPFGNSIKKAYLSHSQMRQLGPGDTLLFYRSGDVRAVSVAGVVESTLVSQDPLSVATYVGPRTVYTYDQIEQMTQSRELLAILFRHDRNLRPIGLDELKSARAILGHPQSLTAVREEGAAWMRASLDELL